MSDFQLSNIDENIAEHYDFHITFIEYQDFVKKMKVYPEKHAIIYPALGLAGEAGEYCEKIKKYLRGDYNLKEEGVIELLKKELGDALWYIASSADDLGFTLEQVAQTNINKLSKRKENGTIKGSGDAR